MKKITYVFAALMLCSSVAFTSCGNGDKGKEADSAATVQKAPLSPVDQLVKMVDKAAAQLSTAATIEDVSKLEQEIGNDVAAFEKKYPDYKPNQEEQEKLRAAIENLREVGIKRIEELTKKAAAEGAALE